MGVLCGAVCGLLGALPLPPLLRGAALCLAPLVLTGGIHLDGYADTWDARSSWGDAEKKQAILHDPHCGAFAGIHLGMFFTASFACSASLVPTASALLCLGLSFPLSRALSGWAMAAWPLAGRSGLARTFAEGADRKRVRTVLALLALGLLGLQLCFGGRTGPVLVLAALVTLLRYRKLATDFGGISGDLAGWFLQTCELWQLGALVLMQILEGTA